MYIGVNLYKFLNIKGLNVTEMYLYITVNCLIQRLCSSKMWERVSFNTFILIKYWENNLDSANTKSNKTLTMDTNKPQANNTRNHSK